MDEKILHPGTRRESMLGHARALAGLLEKPRLETDREALEWEKDVSLQVWELYHDLNDRDFEADFPRRGR